MVIAAKSMGRLDLVGEAAASVLDTGIEDVGSGRKARSAGR
ncbi:MAG: hypothetical protein OXG37_00495 [Actinomycetia bacterium]|nr:hypothetical protein [Actinomycetes bacterium]